MHFQQGRIDLANEEARAAVHYAEESGDTYSKGLAYVVLAISCYGKGLFSESTEHVSKGARYCESAQVFIWEALAHNAAGEICFAMQDYAASKNHFAKAASLCQKSGGLPSFHVLNKTCLAAATVSDGERPIDLESLYEVVSDVPHPL